MDSEVDPGFRFPSPTQCPDEVVLGSGGQHGQVQVDHLSVEGCVGDEVIVNVSLHGEDFADGQEDEQAEERRGHLPNHLRLRKHTHTHSSQPR